uniref:Uncharacterized protein n=1 Tax=Arundo donax TaxID=35708 RepID=A0A0A9CJ62_ARUDO
MRHSTTADRQMDGRRQAATSAAKPRPCG